MTRFSLRLMGVGCAGALLVCGAARANETISIDDLAEGNIVLIPGAGNPNAGIVPGTVVALPEHLTFEYQWNANAPAVIPAGTTDSVGMEDPVTGKLSDVLQFFTVAANPVTYKFDFYSDDENGNLPPGAVLNTTTSIDENGQFQTLGFFGDTPNKLEIEAASDIEVPEPVSGLLIPLAGLVFRRTRRAR